MKAQAPGSIVLPPGLQQGTSVDRVVVHQMRPPIPRQFRRVGVDASKTPTHSRHNSVDSYGAKERPRPDSVLMPAHLLKPASLESIKEPEPMHQRQASLASIYSFPSGTVLQQGHEDKPLPQLPIEPRHYRVKKLALRALKPVLGTRLTYRLFRPLRPLIDGHD